MSTQPNEIDERILITRTLAGDDDAFAALVRTHQTSVYNIAYRLVGQRETAQGLAQETFLRAFKALPTFDLNRPLGPWLYRIATNLSLNWVKRARLPMVSLEASHPVDEEDTEPLEIPDTSAEPAARFVQAEMQAQLRQAILTLPSDYRAVIELRHFQEMDYEEMAEALNIPIGTIKTRLFRARRLLRDRLAPALSQ
jgi:RNA polymerase sigma-70 factor (ECF subfamily)